MGNCCQCDCACCCNDTDSENDSDACSEEEKYPENDAVVASEGNALELQETKSVARNKRNLSLRWTRSKSKHLKIDYFNKVATDLIQYKIAPYLFIYEQIGLSRINKTFSKLFNMSTFDYTPYRDTQLELEEYFNTHINKKSCNFLEEGNAKVGTCSFMKLTKHEIKLVLYFIIAQHQYDKAIHLWSSNITLKSKEKTNCHQFISNLVYHITPFTSTAMTEISCCGIFNKNSNFFNCFIEPFSKFNMTYKAYNTLKFRRLKILNLDFNQGMNDKNCAKLFEKCVIPEVCPNLEQVNLSCTSIGDTACKSIMRFYEKNIKKGIKLNKLYLDDNYRITSYGVDQLNSVFKLYNSLAPINAKDTQFRLKNELNKRNWRLYKAYWAEKIVTGYKPPAGTIQYHIKKKGGKGRKNKMKPASGGGSAKGGNAKGGKGRENKRKQASGGGSAF